MKNVEDVITPSDRRNFLKKVGFGAGALALGSAALGPLAQATERCTTTCSGGGLVPPPTSTQDTHNYWHVPLYWNSVIKAASAAQFGSSANAAAALGYYLQNNGWFGWLNANVSKYTLPTSTQINAVITQLEKWGTPFSYSQVQTWMTADKTTLVNNITTYGSSSLWNSWVNSATWASQQNASAMWNRLVHPSAGMCTNMARVAEFSAGLGGILFVIPGLQELSGAFVVVGGVNAIMHSLVC